MSSAPLRSEPRILFITPEVFPLCKTGGLGDVSAALPAALRVMRMDVRLLIPGYPQVMQGLKPKRKVAEFNMLPQFPSATLRSAKLSVNTSTSIPVFIIDCPELYQREGGPYQDPAGQDWPDNARRFGLLCKIAAILASDASPLTWRPHLAHCNDWQSGLAPAYLHFHQGHKAASIMTIHNLAFQGNFPPENVVQLGLPSASFGIHGLEYYNNMSFLKGGIYYADHITTVSPNYAKEIQSEPLGFGMQGLLAARQHHISGIVNGIDENEWNPASDPYIARNYSSTSLSAKKVNKQVLQKEMGLTTDSAIPLFATIGRITHQKGYDLLLQVASQLVEIPAQLIILGSGDKTLESKLIALAKSYPGKISVRIGYSESMSHKIEAGADCFLMPSRFEPCGLNQMYSQRYGTPPLVHATGGLLDTVIDCTPSTLKDKSASGFLFDQMTANDFFLAIKQAVAAYRVPRTWQNLQQNGMNKDFSWRTSATAYRKLYLSLSALSSSKI
ncbi:starch synthase [Nitrosomonas aestuarii]|uniref:Glycogen synthase n=1 Tax=Nitrosomonas aestuarii TaxID=52441 RepID=A0A1I3XFD5_9PROT|nr:glycogen synthase GlgA [Nitrosomonas aestuarii]SFK18049.1 starch synthase [Nitrosomonas aestuarii]